MHEDVVDESDLPFNVAGRLELHIKVQPEDACLKAAPQSTPVCTSSLSGVRFVFSLWMDGQSCSLSFYIYIYIHAIQWTGLENKM